MASGETCTSPWFGIINPLGVLVTKGIDGTLLLLSKSFVLGFVRKKISYSFSGYKESVRNTKWVSAEDADQYSNVLFVVTALLDWRELSSLFETNVQVRRQMTASSQIRGTIRRQGLLVQCSWQSGIQGESHDSTMAMQKIGQTPERHYSSVVAENLRNTHTGQQSLLPRQYRLAAPLKHRLHWWLYQEKRPPSPPPQRR